VARKAKQLSPGGLLQEGITQVKGGYAEGGGVRCQGITTLRELINVWPGKACER